MNSYVWKCLGFNMNSVVIISSYTYSYSFKKWQVLRTGQNLGGQKCRPMREKEHKLRHRIIKCGVCSENTEFIWSPRVTCRTREWYYWGQMMKVLESWWSQTIKSLFIGGRHRLNTYYYLPGTALGARNITVYKTKSQIPGTYILVEKDKQTFINK